MRAYKYLVLIRSFNLCALLFFLVVSALEFSAHLVGTETLERVVSKLISDIDQAVVGVDVVQAMRLGLSRRLTHVLAVTKQTVEVEFVGVFAVSCQTGVTKRKNKIGVNYWLIIFSYTYNYSIVMP